MTPPSPTLEVIAVNTVFSKLGHSRYQYGTSEFNRLVKQYNINVVSVADLGRGPAAFMSKAQADEVLARQRPVPPVPEESKTELHLGALETKIDRLEAQVNGLTQANNELVKAANHLADRLNKVLEQLGVQQ